MTENGKKPAARIPPLNGLMAFEAVARLGSFSRAADELSITQSAVSHRISQLEATLGVALLLRVGPLVSLTVHGQELLPHVRQGLTCLREGVAQLSGSARAVVRLSLAPAIASRWLVQRLASFNRNHPDIDLDIVATSRYVSIRNGEADVAIRFGRGDWEGLDSVPLIPVRLYPVCSPAYRKAHPWLRSPRDLARATLLRQSVFPWRPWFESAGIDLPEPQGGPSFSEVSLLIDAAEHAQGVALVADALVDRQLEEGRLVRLFDVAHACDRAYYLVTAAAKPRRPEVDALVQWLLAAGNRA